MLVVGVVVEVLVVVVVGVLVEVDVDELVDVDVDVELDVEVELDAVLPVELVLLPLEPCSAASGLESGRPAATALINPAAISAAKATAMRIRLNLNLPLVHRTECCAWSRRRTREFSAQAHNLLRSAPKARATRPTTHAHTLRGASAFSTSLSRVHPTRGRAACTQLS